MSAVVIGGDSLGGIEKNLYALGVTELIHISGRKGQQIGLPKATAFVVVLTDYVNHSLAKDIKNIAKTRAIPIVFAKRSWTAIEGKLKILTHTVK